MNTNMVNYITSLIVPVASAHSITPEQVKTYSAVESGGNGVYILAGFFGVMVIVTIILMIWLKKKHPQHNIEVSNTHQSFESRDDMLDISSNR